MVRNQTDLGPGIVEWSLPEADIGEVRVCVPLLEDELDQDDARRTWCPVCSTSTTMRAARASDGRRFDLCDGCGLLWHVDRRLGRAVAHRVAVPHEPVQAGRGDRRAAGDRAVTGGHPRSRSVGRRGASARVVILNPDAARAPDLSLDRPARPRPCAASVPRGADP